MRVDAALFLFPKAIRPYITLLGDLLFLLFAVIITKETATLTYTVTFIRRQVSPAMQIPMGLAYLAIPLSFGLMTIRLCQNIAHFVRSQILVRSPAAGVLQKHE